MYSEQVAGPLAEKLTSLLRDQLLLGSNYCRQKSKHGAARSTSYLITLRYLAQIEKETRVSLVAQWLRVCLPMQGARVQALVWEDPTCRGASRPMSHNY